MKEQILLACSGSLKTVQDKISATGVKDKISQFWIAKILAEGKKLREEQILRLKVRNTTQKKEIEKEIVQDLQKWDNQQPTHLETKNSSELL